ncbi:hypothetical protein GCM10009839_22050 [Catenulispora yoronensis]|uniref:Uncharacterized protein n=1 Tax=Catenulispora yoronensis TaxID=450799 RepID=A0ABN2TY29_9ACTN
MTADDDKRGRRADTAARRLAARASQLAAAVQELRGRLAERHPKAAEVVRFGLAPDTIDRCFAVAAQIFITAIPMAIAISAFLPQRVRNRVRESVSDQLGIQGAAAQDVSAFFNGSDSLRDAIGVVGLLAALISATSLTRRLQRIYENQWRLPPGRMTTSAARWALWIVVWIVLLAAQGPVRSGQGGLLVLGWVASALMSVALWWWTPHLLLLRRVEWLPLLPTALLTGLGQTLVGIGSRLLMPTVTGRSVSEYGPFGLVLSLMTWLLVVAGVIVIGAGVGRILGEPGPKREPEPEPKPKPTPETPEPETASEPALRPEPGSAGS